MTNVEIEHEKKLLQEAVVAGKRLREYLLKTAKDNHVFDFRELRQLDVDIQICEREIKRIDNVP
jgi:hypothetical protein